MHVLHVVGARPNFMKAAPVIRAIRSYAGVRQSLVHTGQHYDANMSEVFFRQLEMPAPDVNLGVGSGSHAKQTAEIMIGFEEVALDRRPDIVVLYGDVNSTLAAALVCAKLQIRFAHVEAGVRSNDRSMPEEINRIVTDRLADLLLAPSEDGVRNLRAEGVDPSRIRFVGNVMIDSLVQLLPAARRVRDTRIPEYFALVTLHRPSNVDNSANLRSLLETFLEINRDLRIVFPVHPRTRQRLEELGSEFKELLLLDPMPYVEFLAIQSRATAVLTDSGGVQAETSYLGIPCLTLRSNTEWPITVEVGSNVLVGNDRQMLRQELLRIREGRVRQASVPLLWDGHAGERIADIVCEM
jgi:UDP-N-acetylglucosamine 2-epimerase (non-hydrolysing)